jgi:hypothetical protein
MKKAAVLLCGLLCVVFIAATANAKPPTRRGGDNLDQVARHAPQYRAKRVMRHQHKAQPRMTRQSSRRAPAFVQRPRIKGDLFGENHVRRATARHGNARTNSARDRMQRMVAAKIQPTVNCVDGTNCGKVKLGGDRSRQPVKHKVTSTLMSPEERRQTYMRQVWQYRIDTRAKPSKLKELESGCNDFAACL